MNGKQQSLPVTQRNLTITVASACVALMVGLTTIHRAWIMPAVIMELDKLIEHRIAAHGQHPHVGSVSRQEWTLVLQQLERMQRQLDTISERVK